MMGEVETYMHLTLTHPSNRDDLGKKSSLPFVRNHTTDTSIKAEV